MALRFSLLASQLLQDRESVLKAVSWPVLVWESPPPRKEAPLGFARSTLSNIRFSRPTASEPLVLELHKRIADVDEVTLGRSPDCDIVIDDPTVSRLHAVFRKEPHTGMWQVVDAESHNGTFQAGVLIVPGRPTPLFDRASLRFGAVEMSFLQAPAFEQYVHARARSQVRLTSVGVNP
ncbi:FHA domain-containing protein [Hyalangium minutum]|uniref:FHA domain protein n=1 Tax=Hyalangium minutum TaxID=394096 RepID=A0A085WML0_9BACT|nr:FHA domain-containing protein [Hyalangium minutum]KFE68923.1 FHA domain protein [Hyalangium minutum]